MLEYDIERVHYETENEGSLNDIDGEEDAVSNNNKKNY